MSFRAREPRTSSIVVGVGAALLSSLAPASVSANWVEAPRSIVFLGDDAPGTIREFVDRLEAEGGHASVVYPPATAVVYAEPAALASLAGEEWIGQSHREAIDPSRFAESDPALVRLARVWNRSLEMRASSGPAPPDLSGRPAFPDAGRVPVPLPPVARPRDLPDHIPYGAEYYDTSTYLAGSSAVGVWLLEAAGSTYDWSPEEEVETLAGVQTGLDNWVGLGGAMASLTFFVEAHTGVPVSGVPIENPQSWETVWIDEALSNAGWPGANAFERCFAYNNSIRDDFETNWCYAMFIVDSDPNVNQGLFLGGGYAWAYYGGPWVYMSRYSTWAYNAANYFEAVPQHEAGHIYFATDEYDGIQQWSGYLNNNDHASTTVICAMNQNVTWRACAPTKKQLGWRDDDGDDVMDPLGTPPEAALVELLPDPTANPTPTWTGTATVTTLPNQNPNAPYFPPHDITINTIAAVECRVDAGPWSAATPTDGTFDAYGEGFSWTPSPLADGVHVVEARAMSSSGIWTTVFGTDTITIQGSPVGVEDLAREVFSFALDAGRPNPARRESTIRYTLPHESPARLAVFSLAGARVRTLFDGQRPAGSGTERWDGRDDSGRPVPSGVYFVRLESDAGRRTGKIVWRR